MRERPGGGRARRVLPPSARLLEPTSPISAGGPRADELDAPREPRRGLSRLSLVGIAISVVAVAGVVWWALRQEPPKLPSTPGQLGAVIGAIALYAVATVVRAERWERLLARDGAHAPRADVYALTA